MAENIGIVSFFLVDGLACLALGLLIYLPKSVRALDKSEPPAETEDASLETETM